MFLQSIIIIFINAAIAYFMIRHQSGRNEKLRDRKQITEEFLELGNIIYPVWGERENINQGNVKDKERNIVYKIESIKRRYRNYIRDHKTKPDDYEKKFGEIKEYATLDIEKLCDDTSVNELESRQRIKNITQLTDELINSL